MLPQSGRHGYRARWGCPTARDTSGSLRPTRASSPPSTTVICSIQTTSDGCGKACDWQLDCWSPTRIKRWPTTGSTRRATFWPTTRHVSGTCKMGPDTDPMAVVDQYCRVKGVEKLWVADASVMPRIPRSGGAHATVIMIGERVVDWIAAG